MKKIILAIFIKVLLPGLLFLSFVIQCLPYQAIASNIKALPVIKASAYVENELLVRFKNHTTAQSFVTGLGHTYEEIPYLTERLGIYKIKILKGTTIEALTSFENNENVEFVELNSIMSATQGVVTPTSVVSSTSTDPLYAQQWGVARLHVPEAWGVTMGKETVKIGLLDTGINGLHEDLIGKVDQGMNFQHENTATHKLEPLTIPPSINSDDNGHGTEIAGVIAATRNNGKGIAGICPNCRLIPIKIMNAQQQTDDVKAAASIIWATDEHIPILNLSFGSDKKSKTLAMAVEYASKGNVILVAASGNEDKNTLNYPAWYPEVISVGAVNEQGKRCSTGEWGGGYGSNYGDGLDVMAPGNNIVTTGHTTTSSYVKVNGTSIAAPHIVGILGLLLSEDTTLASKQIIKRLDLAASQAEQGWNDEYGFGIVSANKVLTYDTTPPTIQLVPLQTMPLPPRANFSLTVTDDIQTGFLPDLIRQEKTSSIKKITTQYDSQPVQSIVVAADNYGLVKTTVSSDVPLANGNHTLVVTAFDSSKNSGSVRYTFSVDPAVTPVNFASPTPDPFQPKANKLVVEVVKSSNFDLFDSVLNSQFMMPINNVLVKIKEKKIEKSTNILGKVYFENIENGEYTVSCSYEGEVKEQKVSIPQTQHLKVDFTIIQESHTIKNIDPPAEPKSGMDFPSIWIVGMCFLGVGIVTTRVCKRL